MCCRNALQLDKIIHNYTILKIYLRQSSQNCFMKNFSRAISLKFVHLHTLKKNNGEGSMFVNDVATNN